MSETDRALCREAARECTELARATANPEKKQLLLTRAQEWLKLAYADHDEEFDRLLSEFNSQQMGATKRKRSAAHQHLPMQRQPAQQQQSKIKPRDNK